MCICILHNMLIENEIPILSELDVERPSEFNTCPQEVDLSSNFDKSREIRNGIAKYLYFLPSCPLNTYPATV
jgi:hypothetical protein